MLYVTTRSKNDFYTANRALCENHSPDGGLFLPMRIPHYDAEQIRVLKDHTFFENTSDILNLFFSTHISPWDVKVCFGRNPIRLTSVGPRITVAEFWHNMDASYHNVAKRLYNKMTAGINDAPSNWANIAIRIAALFGLFGELDITEPETVDLCVTADNFSVPMAAWYARSMGLPIGRILCACNENSAIWDLIQRGSFHTGSLSWEQGERESLGLEQLIYCTLGMEEVLRYCEVCQSKGIYQLSQLQFQTLSNGFSAEVVGCNRIGSVISSVFGTQHYVMDPNTAISYGCLQDHRATTGERRDTLLLADQSPLLFQDTITQAAGISQEKLVTLINKL